MSNANARKTSSGSPASRGRRSWPSVRTKGLSHRADGVPWRRNRQQDSLCCGPRAACLALKALEALQE
eukprot:9046614-Lingulodinium_polyedra.AAC.1